MLNQMQPSKGIASWRLTVTLLQVCFLVMRINECFYQSNLENKCTVSKKAFKKWKDKHHLIIWLIKCILILNFVVFNFEILTFFCLPIVLLEKYSFSKRSPFIFQNFLPLSLSFDFPADRQRPKQTATKTCPSWQR